MIQNIAHGNHFVQIKAKKIEFLLIICYCKGNGKDNFEMFKSRGGLMNGRDSNESDEKRGKQLNLLIRAIVIEEK